MSFNTNNILLVEKNNIGVLRLTLNDLENKNALSELMMQKLIEEISKASEDNSVRVIVIAATGNVFCSGHNLKEINQARKEDDKGESYF